MCIEQALGTHKIGGLCRILLFESVGHPIEYCCYHILCSWHADYWPEYVPVDVVSNQPPPPNQSPSATTGQRSCITLFFMLLSLLLVLILLFQCDHVED